MKVLCVGDSMGMPRPGVVYEDTWFYKLQREYPQYVFIDKFKRNLISREYLHDDYSRHYCPDIVIMQGGICDCSPRIINENGFLWKGILVVVKKLRIEDLFWKSIKCLLKRNNEKRVWNSYENFQNEIKLYVNTLLQSGVSKIILIAICTPSIKVQERSPLMKKNIEKYNSVYKLLSEEYKDKVVFINPLNIPDDTRYVDGYHCNAEGHQIVYEALKNYL